MTLQVDRQRLADANQIVRSQLLSERTRDGHWVGELSSSPLSTATAISALVLAEQGSTSGGLPVFTPGEEPSHIDEIYRNDLSELIIQSIQWLARQQNEDGGWGDTDRSRSNIATTMLVQAAFHLTGVPAKYRDLLKRAEAYVESQGGIAGLKRRYEGDKSFAVPILANCALADMVPWRKVAALPFELACLPQRWYNRLNLPVVSYAIPALVAIGQAKFHHCPPRNPLVRWIRRAAQKRSLALLAEKQPQSGGFLEATPLTSFVVMSLASIGKTEHPIVRHGVEFLLASVRSDGSWPIDTNLATWNSSQALLALDWQCSDWPNNTHRVIPHRVIPHQGNAESPASPLCSSQKAAATPSASAQQALEWLLGCQHREKHPFTGAEPGGWAWTDLSGGVPDADDTAAALLALAAWRKRWPEERASQITQAARAGINWLLKLQNNHGGWPTFCRGWGKFPFDRSSTDITAHAIRALHVWSNCLHLQTSQAELARRIGTATQLGLQYLEQQQQADGCWLPLWFGNEQNPQAVNPVYGTAKVLFMYQELNLGHLEIPLRGMRWLTKVQHATGGWGAVCDPARGKTAAKKTAVGIAASGKAAVGRTMPRKGTAVHDPSSDAAFQCSIEETALAISALLPYYKSPGQLNGTSANWSAGNRSAGNGVDHEHRFSSVSAQHESSVQLESSIQLGLSWLIEAIEQGHLLEPAPIGFYFAKLWYYERLYPQIFAAQALASACRAIPAAPVPVGAGFLEWDF